MAKRQPLEVTVKETIDFMYEMLIQHPNGTEFNASTLGNTPSRIVSLLVERNIIERTTVFSKDGRKFRYKWVATMAPTKVLYGSIAQQLRDWQEARNKSYNAKKKDKQVEPAKEEPILTTDEPRIEKDADTIINELAEAAKRNPLEIYGIDELWDELKRRGCYIEDNHLVLVKKVVFD